MRGPGSDRDGRFSGMARIHPGQNADNLLETKLVLEVVMTKYY